MRLAAFALLFLSACADFPVLDDTITDADRAANFPELINVSPLLAQSQSTQSHDTANSAFASRLAALKARAERLRRLDI